MRSTLPGRLLTALLFLAATLVVADGALRLFVVHSERSYGRLFGTELPPYRIVPWDEIPDEAERRRWFRNPRFTLRGQTVTNGDLYGILREDPVLGHAPQENTASENGWWHANNFGARSRERLEPVKAPDRHRVLVFGDSYAQGSRLRDEEVWSALLSKRDDRLEVWNFGVDGYSMAQSYLRFRQIASELDFDLALLVFLPGKSLWRDVNTIRYIAERWESYKINPRFVLNKDRLQLIPSPYEDLAEMVARNKDGITDELRQHLRKYDAFYLESKYERVPLRDRSILLKLFAAKRIADWDEAIKARALEPGSEAQRVSRKIFDAANLEAVRRGKEFLLVVLPDHTAVERYREEPEYMEKWEAATDFVCSADYACVDLMQDFLEAAVLDTGHDGSHFGPRTNGFIAELVWRRVFDDDKMNRRLGLP